LTSKEAGLIIAPVNTIKAYRKHHGITQADFAFIAGVSQTRVSQWESGEEVPPGKCPAIERYTEGALRCETLRPDIDWRRDEEGVVTSYCVHIRGDDV
jgi:DNA-binding transcriptional regulator YdaS (Cro superfamily)